MTRLEELEVLIKQQEEKVEEAGKPLTEKIDAINKEFVAKVELITQAVTKRSKCYFNINGWGSGSGRCEIQDENGERKFGADFDISFSRNWDDNTYHLSFNIGTCGSFTKEDTYQIDKYKMFAAMFDYMGELENFLIGKVQELKPLQDTYADADMELDRLVREKRKLEEQQATDALIAAVQPGKVYVNAQYSQWRRNCGCKGYHYARFVGFTGKSANLEVGYYTADNAFQPSDTYRMNKEDFISAIKYKQLYEVQTIK